MTDKLPICGKPGLAKNDTRCVREPKHDGECYIWHQADNHHVMVYEATTTGEAVMHINVDGRLDEMEVAAIVQFMDWAARSKENV